MSIPKTLAVNPVNSASATQTTSWYTAIPGSAFEHVIDEKGQTYQFSPAWKVMGYADTTNDRIPTRNPNYVFDLDFLRDVLFFLSNPMGTGLWLTGPTGCGKTSGILEVAARLNWPVIDLTCSNRFEFAELKGQWGVTQDEKEVQPTMKYIHAGLALAMKYGWILILNEADLASPGELAALNDILEGRNLVISENKAEVIKPHKMFRLVVTGNSNGSGDTTGLYAGVQQQNVAAMDRYRVLKVSYPSFEIEKGILANIAQDIPEEMRDLMCKYAQEMRGCFMRDASISIPFSTRTLVHWAEALRMYLQVDNPLKKSLELYFLNKLSDVEYEAAVSTAIAVFGKESCGWTTK